jgi:uncharacterized protein YciI
MTKTHFFIRLVPPRASFIQDMTAEERDLMQQHSVYTRAQFDAGKILVYGPVMDARGPFGMAVFEAESDAEVRRILDEDPTVKAGLNRYEVSPMRVAAARAT